MVTPSDRTPSGKIGRAGVIVAATLVCLYGVIGWFFASHIHHGLDPSGSPAFYDFSAFHQAATLADHGRAIDAYNDKTMIAAEQAAFPGVKTRLPWNYPPTFQLMLMPLGALPYGIAWLVWSAVTYGGYALVARKLFDPGRLYLALLAPAAAANLLVGQNGLLSTALVGGGTLLLKRRPILGGVLLGLMSYKPHFAVLVPLVLICGREWRALAGAVAAGAVMALASAAVLGVDPWLAFLHRVAALRRRVPSSSSTWRNIPSVMIMAQTLGLDARLSAVCHWVLAAEAAAGALWAWTKTRDASLRAGALAAAIVLVTPYLRIYDLALADSTRREPR